MTRSRAPRRDYWLANIISSPSQMLTITTNTPSTIHQMGQAVFHSFGSAVERPSRASPGSGSPCRLRGLKHRNTITTMPMHSSSGKTNSTMKGESEDIVQYMQQDRPAHVSAAAASAGHEDPQNADGSFERNAPFGATG